MQRKALSFFFMVLITFLVRLPLSAQEEEEEPEEPDQEAPINPNWADYTPFGYSKGDQMLVISLPTIIVPTVFTGEAGAISPNLSPVGLGLTIGYSYFLTPGFFIGGELGGTAITSKAENWLYLVPFGVKVGYQFTLQRSALRPDFLRNFEFPISLVIGGAGQSYLNHEETYFGLFLKPGVGIFFRFHQSWSVGVHAEWWWVPQWPKDEWAKRIDAHFFECTATIRYHF